MKPTRSTKAKRIPASLYIYSIAYIAFFLLLPVIYQNRRLTKILPPLPGNRVFIVGYLLGFLLILMLSVTTIKGTKIISGVMMSFVLIGSVYINRYNLLYNDSIRFPLIHVTKPGNFAAMAELSWPGEIPFGIYNLALKEYQLKSININPNIINLKELLRIEGFGVYINITENVPDRINSLQYSKISSNPNLVYSSFWDDDVEYLLYEAKVEDNNILLTSYQDKVIFIPLDLIYE